MKDNSVVMLERLLTVSGPQARQVLTAFLMLDTADVHNTARKRETRADGLQLTYKTLLEYRKDILSADSEIMKEVFSYKDKKDLQNAVMGVTNDACDRGLLVGYLLGRFGDNNEYLDEFVAKIRMYNQQAENKDPEFAAKEKAREESLKDHVFKVVEEKYGSTPQLERLKELWNKTK